MPHLTAGDGLDEQRQKDDASTNENYVAIDRITMIARKDRSIYDYGSCATAVSFRRKQQRGS